LRLRPWQLDGEGQLLKLRRGTEDERVVYTDLRLDNYLNLKQHRLHVPEAVAHRGLLWWRGQLALYMLRPNAYVTHLLQIEFQSLAWHQHAGLSCFSVSLASLLLCFSVPFASLSLLLLCFSVSFASLSLLLLCFSVSIAALFPCHLPYVPFNICTFQEWQGNNASLLHSFNISTFQE